MKAVTESGQSVLLKADGTWAPIKAAERRTGDGFRKSPWGATVAQAKASESIEPRYEADDYLDFALKLGRFSCLAVYIFVNDQLVRGKYRVLDQYQNQNNYISAYDELKESIAKKYGSPDSDNTYWLNDLYKDDYPQWGLAVSCGHLSTFATWKNEESTITLALHGENFEVNLAVEYSSSKLAALEDAAKESALLEDL